jgi:hypothetical protein
MIIIIILINCKWVDTHPVAIVNLHITYARTMKVDWEACSGNWERKNGNHPSICCREGYMGSM